ncbi:MAG: amidohydrolase family protein [Bryobacterales bacterium]|nr:amidohydrolase family protein [Bryobacterales bacterium]
MMTRREALACLAGTALAAPADLVVETHVHLFSKDRKRFPPHPSGMKAGVAPLEDYLVFAREAGIAHSTHVSAEPYQDDMRYLEYTLENAPRGFLKGTILFDSIGEDTPRRMEAIVKRHSGRIVAMRVHCTRGRNEPPTTGGMLRDRDLLHPKAQPVWKKAADLDIAIQAHIQPYFAPQIEKMGRQFPGTRIILDHFGHAGVGGAVKTANGWVHAKAELGYHDPKEFDQVLRLAKLPQVILKVSGLQYSSRQPFPHTDIRPYARRAFDAFGPDRMVWGSFGSTLASFREKVQIFDANFDFLSAADRAKIRGLTAKRLYGF